MSERSILLYVETGMEVEALVRTLETDGLRISTQALPGRGRRAVLRTAGADAVVVVFGALGESEVRLLRDARSEAPSLPLIAAAPRPDAETSLRILREGWADHVLGSGDVAGIFGTIRGEAKRVGLAERNRFYLREIRRLKSEQNRQTKDALRMEEIYDATVENLMAALDLRDVETFGHSQTVAKYTEILAKILGLSDPLRLAHLRTGALLHDIGKIAIPDSILKKPGPLTPEEWEKVKLHPTLGYGLIKEIKLVPEVGRIILYHHERFDGTGYPKGLKKDKIPFEARIFAVADALDAVTAHRPYREARTFPSAKAEIVRGRGTQFDPAVVDAFLSLSLDRWERLRFETTSHLPPIEEFSSLLRKVKR